MYMRTIEYIYIYVYFWPQKTFFVLSHYVWSDNKRQLQYQQNVQTQVRRWNLKLACPGPDHHETPLDKIEEGENWCLSRIFKENNQNNPREIDVYLYSLSMIMLTSDIKFSFKKHNFIESGCGGATCFLINWILGTIHYINHSVAAFFFSKMNINLKLMTVIHWMVGVSGFRADLTEKNIQTTHRQSNKNRTSSQQYMYVSRLVFHI